MSSQKGDKGRDHEETEILTSGNALKGQGCEEAGCKTTKEGPVIKTFINEDGTTSSYFDKRRLKIAPRSTLQFKVGPPFDVISNYCCVKDSSTGEELDLSLAPRIDRGFDYINGEWIGYKRNYFTLVCSFGVHNMGTHEFLNGSFSVTMLEGQRLSLTIRYFAVRLVAACDEDKSEINLVQHTAKRDKGPQFAPPIHALIPSELPNHQTIREASNVRNEAKMKKYDSLFFLHRQRVKSDYSPNSLLCTYPDDSIKKVARYERVQFSSSINAKKPSQQNKHFKLRVVLGCVVKGIHVAKSENGVYRGLDCIVDGGSSTFVPIMEMETPPLIIRGRSPSNYSCPVKAPEPTQGVNNHRENHIVTNCAKLNSNLTVDTADDVTSSPVREKQLNKSVRKTRKTPNPKQIAPDVATEDDTISMDGEDQFVSLQTMSYIEAVIIKNLPLVLRSTVNGKDIEGCPKASGHTIPAVGMKDIELGSIMRMSPQGLYDHDFLTSFRDDPFNDAVIDAYPHYHQPDPLSASKLSVKNKKRKLNNKMTLNDDHIVYRSPSQNVKESSEDSVEYLTLENSYNYPLQVTSRGHDAMSIPRSLGPNPMDISFCLNVDSETTVLPRPISSTRLSSRRLLTATAKPSDVFGVGESFDEPSIYNH